MSRNREKPKLHLKSGVEVEARPAYSDWRMLEGMYEARPHEFQAILRLAQGKESGLSPSEFQKLRIRYVDWFIDDQTVVPLIRDILTSMYRDTREGVVLVNPFQLTNESERQLLLDIEAQCGRVLRHLRDRGEPPSGHSIR
jgi:hypothetical protein